MPPLSDRSTFAAQVLLALGVVGLASACEGGNTPSPAARRDAGGVDSRTTARNDDAGRLVDDAADGAADAAEADANVTGPGIPVLVTATLATHGTMSLSWQLPASMCATVEINRSMDGGAYALAQTLTGRADEARDMPGHAAGTYCYTITCTLDGVRSPASNEKCVTQ
jgi:hypothetical protein